MIKVNLVVKSENGLHARPASIIVSEASKFVSDIEFINRGKKYNAKSIMGLLSMGAAKGEFLTISADGSDEEKAINTLVELINNFNE